MPLAHAAPIMLEKLFGRLGDGIRTVDRRTGRRIHESHTKLTRKRCLNLTLRRCDFPRPLKKMPRHYVAAFWIWSSVCRYSRDSRSAEDAAKNVSPAIVAVALVAVALVSIPGVLPIALVIAAHKALTKSLRVGILVVARSLWIVALPALPIAGAGVQSLLVPLVQLNLIPLLLYPPLLP